MPSKDQQQGAGPVLTTQRVNSNTHMWAGVLSSQPCALVYIPVIILQREPVDFQPGCRLEENRKGFMEAVTPEPI